MRVLFTEEMRLYLELKWMAKPIYKPQRSLNVVFPRRRWVNVKIHLFLSEGNDGRCAVPIWL